MRKTFLFWLLFLLCCTAMTAYASLIYDIAAISNGPTGFVQTPIGGGIGTSDYQRPTLQELGIHQFLNRDHNVHWRWPAVTGYAGYQQIDAAAFTTLASPLLTYGQKFSAGTAMQSNIKFDWYCLGVSYPLEFLKNIFAAQIELALLDFNYQFNTKRIATGRNYHHLTLRIGATFTVPINSEISLSLTGATKLFPFDSLDITTGGIALLVNTHAKTALHLGTHFTTIDFEDGQAMPNHLYLKTGMMPFIS